MGLTPLRNARRNLRVWPISVFGDSSFCVHVYTDAKHSSTVFQHGLKNARFHCMWSVNWESDNDNGKSHKYVCTTIYQSDTKSNPYPIPNRNRITKLQAVAKHSIVSCPTYPEKFTQDDIGALFYYTYCCHSAL